MNWKVHTPYGREHGLEGFEGLVAIYCAYQSVCDTVFRDLPVPKLQIEHEDDWPSIYRRVSQFLGVAISAVKVPPE